MIKSLVTAAGIALLATAAAQAGQVCVGTAFISNTGSFMSEDSTSRMRTPYCFRSQDVVRVKNIDTRPNITEVILKSGTWFRVIEPTSKIKGCIARGSGSCTSIGTVKLRDLTRGTPEQLEALAKGGRRKTYDRGTSQSLRDYMWHIH